MDERAAGTVEAVFREEWGRLLATLVGWLGDLDLAEEVARAHCLRQLGRLDEAAQAYRLALAHVGNDPERAFLQQQLATVEAVDPPHEPPR